MVRAAKAPKDGAVRFSLKGASLEADGPFSVELKNINLDVRGGEVIAIAGVAGNGQSELFDAISGERPLSRGDAVSIDGASCGAIGVTAPADGRFCARNARPWACLPLIVRDLFYPAFGLCFIGGRAA